MLMHQPTSTPAPVWYALTFASTLLSNLTLVIVFMGGLRSRASRHRHMPVEPVTSRRLRPQAALMP
jgi:hypothetical protein